MIQNLLVYNFSPPQFNYNKTDASLSYDKGLATNQYSFNDSQVSYNFVAPELSIDWTRVHNETGRKNSQAIMDDSKYKGQQAVESFIQTKINYDKSIGDPRGADPAQFYSNIVKGRYGIKRMNINFVPSMPVTTSFSNHDFSINATNPSVSFNPSTTIANPFNASRASLDISVSTPPYLDISYIGSPSPPVFSSLDSYA